MHEAVPDASGAMHRVVLPVVKVTVPVGVPPPEPITVAEYVTDVPTVAEVGVVDTVVVVDAWETAKVAVPDEPAKSVSPL